VNDDSKYWEKIISDLDAIPSSPNPGIDPEDPDYKSCLKIKDKLKEVFLFDQYDKPAHRAAWYKEISVREKKEKNRQLRSSFARAAIILMALLSGALIYSKVSDYIPSGEYAEITVPLGQMTMVRLPDGTQVWLNSGTSLKYPAKFDHSSRQVFLDGEAYFSVSHNERKPFTVFAGNFSLTVLGTSFNVDAYSEDPNSSVTLVEGSVVLQDNKASWKKKLYPGQMATIGRKEKAPTIVDTNTDFYTSWKEGKVVFKSETFEEIANKLERWYNVEINFEDPGLKRLKFSGTFLKYKPIEQVFSSICIMNPVIGFKMENRVGQKNRIIIYKSRP